MPYWISAAQWPRDNVASRVALWPATAGRLLDLILQIMQLQHIWDIHQGEDETLPLQMVISYY